jgi:CubicO group peptidase (beta-lactamase class C family)
MRSILIGMTFALAAWAAGDEEKRVDEIFEQYTKPGSPGCAVGVLRHGATVLSKGYGYADLDQSLPITPRSRFYMASVSKQFTSMALLMAEQDGKLKLDDSIRKYIPELPAYADGITLRRMLDHTAGFRDYLSLWGMRGFSNESVLKEAPTLALIARQKALNFAPGTDQNYSNTGYLLAAIALRRATGKPLETYVHDKIYKPLEMQSTRFQADHGDPVPNRAHGYQQRGKAWKTVDVGFDVIGSGGMYSNIEDMLRWARNFEKPVVGGELLKALQTPGKLVDGRPTPGGYALGMIDKNGAIFHTGGAVGYSTLILRVPKEELTVLCLCNVGGVPIERLGRLVARVYTGAPVVEFPGDRLTLAPRPWQPGEMEKLAASYWSEELFTVWQLTPRDGKLYLQTDGPEFPVQPAANGAYKAGDFELKPTADRGLEASVGRAKGITFSRR